MHKKLILAGVTVAIGLLSYFVLSIGDRRRPRPIDPQASTAVRQFITPTTQSSKAFSDSEISLSPGEHTRVRVYDEVTGRLKYQFEAKEWEPASHANPDFDLKKIQVQILMPRGEITYISADEAHIAFARKGKTRLEPKNGVLKKNVKVVVDRTTTAWREANPTLAAREAHPDELIHIDLDEAHFDLEQAELTSDGPVKVDSVEAKIENVSGLAIQWNQVDGRIDVLRFKHGGTMALRRGGKMIDFAMPGTERDATSQPSKRARAGAGRGDDMAFKVPKAQANQPLSIDAVGAEEAAAQIRLEGGAVSTNIPRTLQGEPGPTPSSSPSADLRDANAVATAMDSMQREARAAKAGELIESIAREQADKKRRRVNTYRAVLTNKVRVEQKDGSKTLGKLEADKLELNFDFGKQQREMADGTGGQKNSPASQPVEPNRVTASAGPVVRPAMLPESPVELADATRLVLTWDGPLEMRPLRVDPSEQTGQRFDAVASGQVVTLQSERGNGVCKQLVYRHERRQAWLSSDGSAPVQLVLDGTRKLIGKEIFFDQRRGLARVEGAGTMLDEGKGLAVGGDGLLPVAAGRPGASAKNQDTQAAVRKSREPVKITWTRGVDIEIGSRLVERLNPTTGAKEQKQKEFLRRAWFHGDVAMNQGSEHLTAEQVAITFGAPHAAPGDTSSDVQVADHIEHLNMTGQVRLQREQDLIVGEVLDAEMTVVDGRNIPHIVDVRGDVLARQGPRLIRADQMHVTLGMVRGKGNTIVKGDMIVEESKPHAAIETLDAQGRVFVQDPDNHLKIRDAQKLKATLRDGNQLVRADIESSAPDILAKVRSADTAIHGHRIEIDVPNESVDVPGPGKAWMIAQQDLGGRKLTKPSPVKITWSNEMQMRGGERNYGVFLGDVRTRSEAFGLSCDKLTVRLASAPVQSKLQRESLLDHFWLTKRMAAMKAHAPRQANVTAQAPKKRPTYVVAEGRAEAISSTYASAAPDGNPGRLLSRMQIAGQQIAADLSRERLSVPGKGTLLIEDYQFDGQGRKSKASGAAPRSGPLMSAAQGDGPSQTLVTWANSMDYYVDKNLVAFDRDVEMRHVSGQQIVMKDELASGMGLDPSSLKRIKSGRLAQLTAGSLLLEFRTASTKDEKTGQARLVRATDLERLVAKHEVHLQEGTKSLMGDYVQFLANTNEVQVEGSPGVDARIMDQEEGAQRGSYWRGPILIWNRRTNRIEAPQASLRTSRR